MDKIKEKIEEIVKKIKADPKLMSEFKSEPVKTIEKLIGVDLPDDAIEKVVDGVKAKMSMDKLSGAADKLKGLFKK
jgi:hypothetical protein